MWSLRNNNNYKQTGLLVSLNYVANNRRSFLENFYEKSKRSILKARTEGPAAWVLAADEPSLGRRPSCCACCRSSMSRSRARPRRSASTVPRGRSRRDFPVGQLT